VREALASGLEVMSEDVEETKQRQDSVESQFQAVLDETTGKDVISAPEITAARVGADNTNHPNLKERLDTEYQKLNSQLAQTAYLANSLKNSKADRTEVQNFESMLNDIIVSNGDDGKDTELIASRGGFDTLPERLNANERILDNIDKSLLKFVNEVDNGDFSQD